MKDKNASGFKAPLGLLLIGISGVLVLTLIISIIINSLKMKEIEKTDEELTANVKYFKVELPSTDQGGAE